MLLSLQRIGSLTGLFTLVLFATTPVKSKVLKGAQFVQVMQGNTLSGHTPKGVPFNLYFLPGGSAKYEEKGGPSDFGKWRMSKANRVCVTWRGWQQGRENCYVVTLEGRKVSWTGASESGSGFLRGFIASSFLRKANN